MSIRLLMAALPFALIGCAVLPEEESDPQAVETEAKQPCEDAVSTPEMAACYGAIVSKSEQRHDKYLAHAIERQSGTPSLAKAIRTSDAAFRSYRDSECDAVLESYDRGTIKGLMRQLCVIETTDQRALIIWQNWHQYSDSTPPEFPRPEPYLP